MKKYLMMIMMMFLLIALFGCDEKQVSNQWVASDLAGIQDPGFNIVSKNETKNAVSFVLQDVDMALVQKFLDHLYEHPEFIVNVQFNYDTNSYSYAAFNDKQESIHFTYNLDDRSGYFIYAKSGDAVFTPGIRDMGYSVVVNYDYMSNKEQTHYAASLTYSIILNIKFTSIYEQLVSFTLKDFQFKSPSVLGSLSFRHSGSSFIEGYSKTGSSPYDMLFLVEQNNVGQYPVSTPYGSTSTFFTLMGISQSNLDFVVTFKAEITTTSGVYTYDYEIKVMPVGNDVTLMDRTMTVHHWTQTLEQGKPYRKIS